MNDRLREKTIRDISALPPPTVAVKLLTNLRDGAPLDPEVADEASAPPHPLISYSRNGLVLATPKLAAWRLSVG
jgi:hypothetical protein